MVNMLLPGDWIYNPKYSDLFLNPIPKQPIVGERRLEMLGSFSLNLPEEWNPETDRLDWRLNFNLPNPIIALNDETTTTLTDNADQYRFQFLRIEIN